MLVMLLGLFGCGCNDTSGANNNDTGMNGNNAGINGNAAVTLPADNGDDMVNDGMIDDGIVGDEASDGVIDGDSYSPENPGASAGSDNTDSGTNGGGTNGGGMLDGGASDGTAR